MRHHTSFWSHIFCRSKHSPWTGGVLHGAELALLSSLAPNNSKPYSNQTKLTAAEIPESAEASA